MCPTSTFAICTTANTRNCSQDLSTEFGGFPFSSTAFPFLKLTASGNSLPASKDCPSALLSKIQRLLLKNFRSRCLEWPSPLQLQLRRVTLFQLTFHGTCRFLDPLPLCSGDCFSSHAGGSSQPVTLPPCFFLCEAKDCR